MVGPTNVSLRPCHYRAIQSSRDRSVPDAHGQCHGGRDLRRSSANEVAILLGLALQAGGRLAEACIGLAVPGWPIRYLARARQACGWPMLTIQGMPNWSTHMPNSSPHICFSKGTDTVPPSDSFSQ
jgi:hypothetical protein